jgi:DMSO reductase family type II enzyme heme b subunit
MSFKIILFRSLLLILSATAIASCENFDIAKCQADTECGPIIEIKKVGDKLPDSPNDPIWSSNKVSKPVKMELGPQLITNPQWPNPATKEIRVQAATNGSEIAILLEWDDSSHSMKVSYSDMYTDQAALMFPVKLEKEAPPITMGAEGYPMNIWQWKEILEKPEKKNLFSRPGPLSKPNQVNQKLDQDQTKSPIEDLNAEGFSTLTYQDHQDVKGKGVWTKGKWRTLFRRKLKTNDNNDVQITGNHIMAIAVWNGANRERNGQKGLSKWLYLKFI